MQLFQSYRLVSTLLALGLLSGLSSCASYIASRNAVWQEEHRGVVSTPVEQAIPPKAPDQIRQSVIDSARSLLGQKPDARVSVRGRNFMLDCIGTVSAAWWGAGFDIQQDFADFNGNGVKRLYESCQAWGVVNQVKSAQPGDIVFWENTYDRNGDGIRYNDGLTHAGIVISIDADGTVEYLHESVTRGVTLARFNLLHPDQAFGPGNKVWNSPMYLGSSVGSKNNPPYWLSGELVSAFADGLGTANSLSRP